MNKILTAVFAFTLTIGLAYAESFTGTTRVFPDWSHKTTGLTTVSETFASSLFTFTHTSGNGANQMNQLWHSTETIVASGTNVIDLTGGITNAFGTVLTMAEVRLLTFKAGSTNASTIQIGGGASAFSSMFADASDALLIRPGGFIMLVGPDATGYTAGSGNLTLINNSGAGVATIDIYIGASD